MATTTVNSETETKKRGRPKKEGTIPKTKVDKKEPTSTKNTTKSDETKKRGRKPGIKNNATSYEEQDTTNGTSETKDTKISKSTKPIKPTKPTKPTTPAKVKDYSTLVNEFKKLKPEADVVITSSSYYLSVQGAMGIDQEFFEVLAGASEALGFNFQRTGNTISMYNIPTVYNVKDVVSKIKSAAENYKLSTKVISDGAVMMPMDLKNQNSPNQNFHLQNRISEFVQSLLPPAQFAQ